MERFARLPSETSTHPAYVRAFNYAVERATRLGIDMAIRRVKWYGQDGYTVSGACHMDSDYARAEIVKPNQPPMTDITTDGTYERIR